MPVWLDLLAATSLALGVACAMWLALDVARRPPPMPIMRLVWPICGLFGGPPLAWFYARFARTSPSASAEHAGHGRGRHERRGRHGHGEPPMPVAVAKGALHCGSGCALGDVVAETLAFLVPGILVAFGHPGLFAEPMFATWVLDFLCAFALGIVFQYFAIAPMRRLGIRDGLREAVKADALSLVAWQVGMYSFMAVAMFVVYRPWLGVMPQADSPVFWFTMQLAMWCGFATTYPMNWWLIRRGTKEKM